MATEARREAAATIEDMRINPSEYEVKRQTTGAYSVDREPNAMPLRFTGLERLLVNFNAGGSGIGTIPFKVIIPFKTVGYPPDSHIRVGIRKRVDDSFALLAEYPITYNIKSGWNTITVEGHSDYQMVADDKLSIEYPPDPDNTIEIATSTAAAPAGYKSQSYDGETYTDTTDQLAIQIVTKELVAR